MQMEGTSQVPNPEASFNLAAGWTALFLTHSSSAPPSYHNVFNDLFYMRSEEHPPCSLAPTHTWAAPIVAAPATYNRNPLDSKASHRLSSRSSLQDSVSSSSNNNHCSSNTPGTLLADFSLRRPDILCSNNSSSSIKDSSNRSRPASSLLLFRNSSSLSRPDTQASSNSTMVRSNRPNRRFLNPPA
jgi:hypothetical protein